ncbi:Multidrug resistance protein 3 [Anoxybacillus sp. BCO1]|nr:Multidrug resistance protein 3 [Anoxybacillus sp. BCO1]
MISAIFLLTFLYVETKVKEPIISFSLFKRRTFAVAQLLAFLYGATFVILAVFIPVFVQAVYGGTARNAGLILMPMMLGSVAGSSFAGISQTKTSYRNIMFISVIAYFTGMLSLSFMTPENVKIMANDLYGINWTWSRIFFLTFTIGIYA